MRPRLAGLLLLAALLLLAPSSSTRLSAALEPEPGGAAPDAAAHVATKSAPARTTAEQHSSTSPPPTSTSPTPRSSDTAAARAGADHNTAATDALFFFAFMLLIGIFTVHVLGFTRVPYTALLLVKKEEKGRREKRERGRKNKRNGLLAHLCLFFFFSTSLSLSLSHTHTKKPQHLFSFFQKIWGVLLGVALETFASKWPLLPAGARLWEGIDPNLLLAGFLPILLFAGAFALEWHVVRRLLPSSLLLAGPGVLLGAGITAALVRVSFPHDWTWGQCLLFGAMFSATDPVSVVAVLKEAGLSKRLRTLVDLEALLNDGTAYVLFFVLRRFVVDQSNVAAGHPLAGEPTTVSTALVQFVRLAVGGAALGLATGVATTAWLRYMYNAPMPEITITFASAFLTYLVGDRLLGVSGVVSLLLFFRFFSLFFSFFSSFFFFKISLLIHFRKNKTKTPPPPPPQPQPARRRRPGTLDVRRRGQPRLPKSRAPPRRRLVGPRVLRQHRHLPARGRARRRARVHKPGRPKSLRHQVV